MVVGGLGYTNCSYGYGVGNAGGYGYGEVMVVANTTAEPVVIAPSASQGEVLGLALEPVVEVAKTRLEELAEVAALMGWK